MTNKQRDDYITELKSYINDGEINVTDNLNETIYIIDDLKISGDFMDGVRGVDHNVLLTENAEWKDILQWGTVIVPESKTYISDKPIQTLDDLGLDKVPLNNNHIIKEPIQENTKILNNDKQQGLSQQYKNLNKQINSNPDNNQHLKTQLTEVREKISQQTQQELKDYQKQNVDLKKPTQDSRQSLSR